MRLIFPSRDDLTTALTDIATLAGELGALHDQLHAAYRGDPDGYPKNSGFDKASPASELDDDGTPLPPRSDPTAATVVELTSGRSDPVAEAIEILHRAVRDARKALDGAKCKGKEALALPGAPKIIDDTHEWCASCSRVKDHKNRPLLEPTHRTPRDPSLGLPNLPLCRWCYHFALAERQWPPVDLVRKRRDGVRITAQMVEDALGCHTPGR